MLNGDYLYGIQCCTSFILLDLHPNVSLLISIASQINGDTEYDILSNLYCATLFLFVVFLQSLMFRVGQIVSPMHLKPLCEMKNKTPFHAYSMCGFMCMAPAIINIVFSGLYAHSDSAALN